MANRVVGNKKIVNNTIYSLRLHKIELELSLVINDFEWIPVFNPDPASVPLYRIATVSTCSIFGVS